MSSPMFVFYVIPAEAGIQSIMTVWLIKRIMSISCLPGENGTGVYVGVTDNLVRRVWEHKNRRIDGFTKKYEVHHLVYYEIHTNPESAITREKQIKKWNRRWKLRLIEETNPEWNGLYDSLL